MGGNLKVRLSNRGKMNLPCEEGSGNRISSVLAQNSGANTEHYLHFFRHHITQREAGLLFIQQTIS